MTRDEMIIFIKDHPNVKITHWLFDEDEYIYSKDDGIVYDENGLLFEDWKSDVYDGIRLRITGPWKDGWVVKTMAKKEYFVVQNEEGKFFSINKIDNENGYPCFIDDFDFCKRFESDKSAEDFLKSDYVMKGSSLAVGRSSTLDSTFSASFCCSSAKNLSISASDF